MAIQYTGFLQLDPDTSSGLPLSAFELVEEYNAGWEGQAVLTARQESGNFALDEMMSDIVARNIYPGAVVTLLQSYTETATESESETETESESDAEAETATDPPGYIIRAWPSVVTQVEPFADTDPLEAHCAVRLADPMTYLAGRPVWGAYRGESFGAMFGGALSMAAGGDGKPTLSPVLPGLSMGLTIVEQFREELERVPYAIASGETFGEWLAEVTALLGVRIELVGNADGEVRITLTDKACTGSAITFREAKPGGNRSVAPAAGALRIDGLATHPSPVERGAVLDDFTLGSFRRLGLAGTVGGVHVGAVGLDEAKRRIDFETERARAEMVMVLGTSGQPGVRPGRLATLTPKFLQTDKWQVCKVVHAQTGLTYANQTIFMPSDASWHPLPPLPRPPRYITAVVDAGDDYLVQEPVPRDRLSRVPLAFPFAPTPIGEEAVDLAVADADRDRRITLDDFSAADVEAYTTGSPVEDNSQTWEQALAAYKEGQYDDPFPGKTDKQLKPAELQLRRDKTAMRRKMRKYELYKAAKARDASDRDRDGRVTARDTAMSPRLKALMDDPAKQAELDSWWQSYRGPTANGSGNAPANGAGSPPVKGVQALQRDFPDDYERCLANLREIIEYGALFYGEKAPAVPDDTENLPDNLDPRHMAGTMTTEIDAWEEAELADEQWPPRVPLPLVTPMAGALHGFIQPHRQGDVCRVAVHTPMQAEVIGFQYRTNRPINPNLVGATAGLVVEHDRKSSWSGWLFRPGRASPSPGEIEAAERAETLDKLQAQSVTDGILAKTVRDRATAMKLRNRLDPSHEMYVSDAELEEAEDAALTMELRAARSRAAAANAQAAIAAADAVGAPSDDAKAWADATMSVAKDEERQVAELEATIAEREAAAAEALAAESPTSANQAAAESARRAANAARDRARAAAAIAATAAARAKASEAAAQDESEDDE